MTPTPVVRRRPATSQCSGPLRAGVHATGYKFLMCRVSSAVEQRFCKPLVGSSNLSPGTKKAEEIRAFPKTARRAGSAGNARKAVRVTTILTTVPTVTDGQCSPRVPVSCGHRGGDCSVA
jgi:hypothetical protein